jgi:glycosyltransferase involved in cell wall biosynthesis
MKIFLCKGSFYGPVSGADQQIVTYAVHLRSVGLKPVVIITVPYSRTDAYYTRLQRAGVPVVCLGRNPLYLALLALRRIALLLPGLKMLSALHDWEKLLHWTAVVYFKIASPDVVHSIGDGGLFIGAAGTAKIPVIYQELGVPWMEPLSEHGVFYNKVAQSLPFCSEIVALSPNIAKVCREKFPFRGTVSVLPLIVEDTGHDREARPKVTDKVVFGFAARFEWRKGPTLMVEAFAEMLRRFPNAALEMAGQGEEEAKVGERARELGIDSSCRFPGPYTTQEAKRDFMNRLDVFVLSSYAEGTPNSIIEAMSHGLPVVATAVGGVPDVVTPEVGIVIPPGDAKALAAAMELLASDSELRARMGTSARLRYEQLFSPQAVTPLLVQTYRRLMMENRSNDSDEPEMAAQVLPHPWAEVRM